MQLYYSQKLRNNFFSLCIVFLAGIGIFLSPLSIDIAQAQPTLLNFLNITGSSGKFKTENIDTNSLAATAGQITLVALSFLGVVFVSLSVYAGYLWMTAHGNQTQVDKAKEILSNAIIGLFIIFGSYAFTVAIHWFISLGGA